MAQFKVIKESPVYGQEEEGEYDNREDAELRLIDVIAYTISNFDEYEHEDVEAIREQGYERFGAGIVFIEEDGIRPA